MTAIASLVTARKPHRCEDCRGNIQPGDDYTRHVCFPDDEVNQSNRPWVLRLCTSCHTQYGQPLPARRRKAGDVE